MQQCLAASAPETVWECLEIVLGELHLQGNVRTWQRDPDHIREHGVKLHTVAAVGQSVLQVDEMTARGHQKGTAGSRRTRWRTLWKCGKIRVSDE